MPLPEQQYRDRRRLWCERPQSVAAAPHCLWSGTRHRGLNPRDPPDNRGQGLVLQERPLQEPEIIRSGRRLLFL